MAGADHDTLVRRLAMMLVKLNQGESLDPHDLAAEYGVNVRTVQRDLNDRFSYLPLQKSEGRYRLDPAFLGRLSTKDIERFAGLAGVKGLFPSLSDDFLRDIFDSRIQSALLIKGHQYEDLSDKTALFKNLEQAIVSRFQVSYRYLKQGVEKSHIDVEPYKLVNLKGIWYLAAKESGKLKTFSFSKIGSLMVSNQTFEVDPSVDQTLVDEDGVWFGAEPIEFVLKVSPAIAGYFKRRKVLANQLIVKELADGGLIVSAKVGHPNQVMPHVRYWLPHIRIISPDDMQRQLEGELLSYLESSNAAPALPLQPARTQAATKR